jgi:putative flippase GtrA
MKLNIDDLKRFIKFGVVGGIGILVNLSTFFVFAFFTKKSIPEYLFNFIAPILAYEVAVVNNFFFSYFWVWKNRKRDMLHSFIRYNLSTVVAFFINYGIFQGSLYLFGIDKDKQFLLYMFVYAFALGIGMIINFLLIEFKVFKKIENE